VKFKLVTIVFGVMLAVAPAAHAIDRTDANTDNDTVTVQIAQANRIAMLNHPFVALGVGLLCGVVASVSQDKYE